MAAHHKTIKTLEALEALGNKRKPKLDLLSVNADDPVLRACFKLAYDWEQTFGLRVKFMDASAGTSRTKPLFGAAATRMTSDPWQEFNSLLGRLRTRQLSGNAAKEAWSLLLTHLSDSERKWFSRIVNRDLKIGIERQTIDAVWPGLIRPFGVQLAETMGKIKEFAPTKRAPWLGWPAFVEPKLDGMRVVVEYRDETRTCTGFSREGHMLPHIQGLLDPLAAHLRKHVGRSCWVDAEALAGGDFNRTMSVIKREEVPQSERDTLIFHVFDMVHDITHDPRPYTERRQYLQQVLGGMAVPRFVPTPYWGAENMDELMSIYNDMLDAGHEGVMVKFGSAPYQADRNAAWLKLKPTNTVDAEIVGFAAGAAGSKNESRLGAFIVRRGDNGKIVNVGGGLSDKFRDAVWAEQDAFMGKVLEFKEEARSGADTTANFPRFVRMRPDRESA